ncbi:MAG: hypothetical protein Q9184_006117 [Pyrenodesmia sp. 2 TL-2023]
MPPPSSPKAVAVNSISKYFDNGHFTDLTITCGGEEFRCHKVVVCSQSKFFEAACTNGFQESMTSTVDLPDDDPFHVSLMLHFLYRQRYTRAVEDMNGPKYKSRVHVHMYELGDKYDIPQLCHYAAGFLESIVCYQWGENLVHLMNTVRLVYERNPDITRRLRDIVCKALVRHLREIAANGEHRDRIIEMVHEIEQFREDLCLAQLQKPFEDANFRGGWDDWGQRD